MSGLIDAAQASELLGVPKSWILAEARADGPDWCATCKRPMPFREGT